MNAPPTPEGQAVSADPGLQSERTLLAWRRTLLALIVAGFFIWRAWLHALAGQDGQPAGSILGLGIAAAGTAAATVAICGCAIYRSLALRHISSAPPALLLRIATAAVLTLAAAVTASIILSHVAV